MKSNDLLKELTEMTESNLSRFEKFESLDDEQLNFKANENSWSILECLEHLNRYGEFYIPEFEKSINNSIKPSDEIFKTGLLGNYFAKSMLPKEKLNKMKTFNSMNPSGSDLDKSILEEFRNQQFKILELLSKAKNVSLNKNRTGISISKWIKIKLGDSFRIVIYHNLRHIIQAENIHRKG